jgi:hypothetical protein
MYKGWYFPCEFRQRCVFVAACSATLLDLVILRVCDHGCTTTRRWASSSGFVTEYEDDVTFATVQGAGHMSDSASVWRPEAAFSMLQRFLASKPL